MTDDAVNRLHAENAVLRRRVARLRAALSSIRLGSGGETWKDAALAWRESVQALEADDKEMGRNA